MSVRVGDRDEGKLRVIEAMRKLMVYTHDRVKSDNFPKSERWITAKVGRERQRIRKLAAKEAAGLIPEGTTWNSVQSWMGNAMRGDSYFRVRSMREYYMNIMGRYADGNGTGTAFESGA